MARIAAPPPRPEEVVVTTLRDAPAHLSFSQVQKLHPRYQYACPRAWAYGKLLGLEDDAGVNLRVGKALDDAAQAAILGLAAGASTADVLGAAVDVCVASAEAAELGETQIRIARECVLPLVGYLENRGRVAGLQVEQRWQVQRPGSAPVNMLGYPDWIAGDGTIEDLKFTGKARWSGARTGDLVWHADWLEPKIDQLTTYRMGRMFARAHGLPDVDAPLVPRGRLVILYHHAKLSTPQLRTLDVDLLDGRIGQMATVIREAAEIAARSVHPPRPGEPCARCAYAARCRVDLMATAGPTAALVLGEERALRLLPGGGL